MIVYVLNILFSDKFLTIIELASTAFASHAEGKVSNPSYDRPKS